MLSVVAFSFIEMVLNVYEMQYEHKVSSIFKTIQLIS